jgi:uncharacterized membrane protein
MKNLTQQTISRLEEITNTILDEKNNGAYPLSLMIGVLFLSYGLNRAKRKLA